MKIDKMKIMLHVRTFRVHIRSFPFWEKIYNYLHIIYIPFIYHFFFNRGDLTFLVAVNENCSNVCVLKPYDILKVKNAMLKCVHYFTEFNIHNSIPLT